ncbi:MAG: hypothetical protein WD030_07065 [Pirellulales bacterium]
MRQQKRSAPLPKNKRPKRKLSKAEKKAKRLRKQQYETIFINGKQKRVKREPLIDGHTVDEYIAINADDVWLHQHGYYELLYERSLAESSPDGKVCGDQMR